MGFEKTTVYECCFSARANDSDTDLLKVSVDFRYKSTASLESLVGKPIFSIALSVTLNA